LKHSVRERSRTGLPVRSSLKIHLDQVSMDVRKAATAC